MELSITFLAVLIGAFLGNGICFILWRLIEKKTTKNKE